MRIILTILLFLSINLAYSQNILEEGFETWPPPGWKIVDSDADSNQWEQGSFFNGWNVSTGNYCATSASWSPVTGALQPDNWLISPEIDLIFGNTYVLGWWFSAQDSLFPNEYYSILISTSDSIQSFTDVVHQETAVFDADLIYREHDITPYSGQKVYIAFRHHNVSNQFYLNIDDIVVKQIVGIGEPGIMNALKLFPNPVSDKLFLISENEINSIKLFNNLGKLLINQNINKKSSEFDLSGFFNGVYYLRIETEQGIINRIILKL